MKRKYLAYALLTPVLAFGALGVSGASAHGMYGGANLTPDEIASRHLQMFQEQAQIFGLTIDEIKTAWAEGKNLKQLAEEKGIKKEDIQKRMQAAREQKMRTELKTLVDKGVITQAQADKRMESMKKMVANGKGMKKHFRF